MNKINIATVFSGIGSIEHALQRLDIEHNIVFACDIDKYCKQTYFANFKINENQWYNDIKTIDGKEYNGKILNIGLRRVAPAQARTKMPRF